MLPVIAGFFGISVDELLGVTVKDKERRLEEYSQMLRNTKDRKERLEILRRELAEFPGEWGIISDMVHEMTYLPECLDEMRDIVNDAVKRCDDILCRENLIFFYIQSEPDENIANEFIETYRPVTRCRHTSFMVEYDYAVTVNHIRLGNIANGEVTGKIAYARRRHIKGVARAVLETYHA